MISVRTDLKNASNSGRPPMDDQSAGDPLFPGFPWVRAPGPGPPRRADRPCTSRIRHSVSITSGIVRPLTSHLAPLTSHLSPLTSHLSPLTSHLSPLQPGVGHAIAERGRRHVFADHLTSSKPLHPAPEASSGSRRPPAPGVWQWHRASGAAQRGPARSPTAASALSQLCHCILTRV